MTQATRREQRALIIAVGRLPRGSRRGLLYRRHFLIARLTTGAFPSLA
jgi:hypothetical protein